jgi:hypothetical protein
VNVFKKKPQSPPPADAPAQVQGVQVPARVAFTTKEHGAYLVDLTGEGMAVVQEQDGLFLVIRAPVVAMDQKATELIGRARDGDDIPGLTRGKGGLP